VGTPGSAGSDSRRECPRARQRCGPTATATSAHEESAPKCYNAARPGPSSTTVTAEVYSATGGYFTRFALSHTEGTLLGVEPTVDDVVAHFGDIRGKGTVTNELDGEALVWGLQSFAPRLKPLLVLQNRG
jgi:hypothetical protein